MAKKKNELDITAGAEPIEDTIFDKTPVVVPETPPTINDPKWSEYVISLLKDDEKFNELPKVNGLRRLTRVLIGPILKGKVEIKQVPTIDNEQRSTAEYTVVVLNKYQLEDDEEPYPVEFTDAADAWRGNMWVQVEEYARFPTAMASTRAQARALRQALNLSVVAAEEISDQPLEESGFSGKITESQITKIDIKCQQLGINLIKFINSGKLKYKKVEDIPNTTAVGMFKKINKYQQEVEPVPDELKGYDPNWRG